MDESGTINPAALNASASTIAPNLLSQPNPRGTKRGRSPEGDGLRRQESDAAGDGQSTKRSKALKQEDSSSTSTHTGLYATAQAVHTPQIMTQALPHATPSQASPARSTPGSATKPTVIKALPTVRDHTTDQLGPGGDEYIPRETDPDGELKVSLDGHPQDGRKYRCKTFPVPDRGEKMFMLATECARVLGYRDSYLLFNKNRSLYKIIASQQEKDSLIHQDILPYSYRSRQIAIVTARSMFRQFGSRLIEGGKRVRDDYWEAKARKQGFTEEDAAGEKRPGAAKAREAAAAEASHQTLSLPQGEIIYSSGPGLDGQPPGLGQVSLAPLPMIHLPGDEVRPNSYGNIMRPRQDIVGPPYHDRLQSSNPNDILNQASHAAEFNKQLSNTRAHRSKYLDDFWKRPHEQPRTQAPSDGDMGTVAPQHLQSPQAVAGMGQSRGQQDQMPHHGSQMMPQTYGGYPNQQNTMPSPVQQMHRIAPGQIHPSTPMAAGSSHRQTPSYGGYPQNQMWPPPQPQPSPLSQSHHISQYGQQQHHQSSMGPPQMPQQMNYQQMGMNNPAAFTGMNRSMYQPSPSPQQFGMQSSAGQQPGMQGWATPGAAGNMPQDWQRYQ
ncbi:uncharacterized protein LTR77_009632 [Saxophila tyrrhenica]|uniref:Nuclear localization protein n=1 Tax=Saxophila tyrrhenica TaxID=1690608 RepID=A0AAV9P116_9PEZI|nr:hypothetical protein LTR77_009632 [Saxophila tyrrhenica]